MMRGVLVMGVALTCASLAGCATSFTSLDANDNGKISKDEFYGLVSDAGIYSELDYDDDGLLDEEEFDEIGFDSDFDYWDENDDGYLDSGEFYDGVYEYYDYNEDGYWDMNEYDDFGEAGLFDV